jgi:predicted alpha/beta hydrolase
MEITHTKIPATDGFGLAATVYQPNPANASQKVVLIAPAMAVKRSYYDKYARFLAAEGFTVVTFDYRGMGDSRPPSLKGFRATLRDWGEKDIVGLIEWITNQYPSARLLVVSHSVGGQLMGLVPNNHKVTALLAVAAQSGYWRLWDPPGRRYFMCAFWHVMIPVLTRLCSYFPGSRVGMGEDVPAGVVLQWATWGRNPNYIVDQQGQPIREHFRTFSVPLLAYSIEDDTYAPRRTVEGLLSFYSQAQITHRHVSPKDLGVAAIGHFGFFREQFKSSLWNDTVHWLKQQ